LNQGRFIERAIRSVLDQGYENLEYVIVDGGSTDETVEVIRRYEDRLSSWISEPDEGQTDAINKGLRRVSGDVVAYMNSDDYYLPGAFEKAISALSASGATWLAGAARNVDSEGRGGAWDTGDEWRPTLPQENEKWPRGRHWWISSNWSVPQPATFWRRELFERYGEFRPDMHFAFDVEFMERLVLAGEMPLLLRDEFLAARVLHEEAKSFEGEQWKPEYKLLRAGLRKELTWRERFLLRMSLISGALFGGWVSRAAGRFKLRVVHPAIRGAGSLVGQIPEPIRPKVRTRDRKGPGD
jgi:glycosyltransferase involved in cell wall biosynthesis